MLLWWLVDSNKVINHKTNHVLANIDPNKRQEIYEQHLNQIADVKFTQRQVDVMACLLHNRSYGKIAELLAINSTRTIQTHIRDIKNKIENSTTEFVIDFIEKSGKRQYMVEYYLNIVVHSCFTKKLQKIKAAVNRSKVSCIAEFSNLSAAKKKLLEQIQTDLELANITLTTSKGLAADAKAVIHIVGQEPDHEAENNKNTKTCYLLLDDELSPAKDMAYIDFTHGANYYLALMQLIDSIMDNVRVNKITEEFKLEYSLILDSWNGNNFVSTNSDDQLIKSSLSRTIKLLLICLSILLLCILLFVAVKMIPAQDLTSIEEINSKLAELTSEFSADNITTEENRQKNYLLTQDAEKLVAKLDDKQVFAYFTSPELTLDQLINCVCVLHSLANQYTYHQHNGIKARRLVLTAKILIENFIANKNNNKITFDELTPEEILTELKIFLHLPEIYTRVIYLLARTYVYQGDIQESVRYFETAHYLGEKLNIFEGYLSIRSGLEIVRGKIIEDNLQIGNIERATASLLQGLEVLKKLKDNNKEYIVNYNHKNKQLRTITPSKDNFNKVFCIERMVSYYAKLLLTTDNIEQQKSYMRAIANLFLGDSSQDGLLTLVQNVIYKRAASVYNSLGNILLSLHSRQLQLESFKQALIKKLELKQTGDLDVIAEIFTLARAKSRKTDYAKADAYDGLIRVYQEKLKQVNLGNDQRKQLNSEIEHLIAKRDDINNKIARSDWRLKKHDLGS